MVRSLSVAAAEKVTYFEELPPELIIIIFELLTPDDLCKAFLDLNERINCIVKSMLNMSLKVTQQYADFTKNFRPHQFHRLVIPICASMNFEITQFSPQLRSLTIIHPTHHQLTVIHPDYFPNLQYLNIESPSAFLCQLIFSNRFPRLTKVCLTQVNLSRRWTQSPSIRSLTMYSDDPQTFQRVLQACPSLQTFNFRGQSMPSIPRSINPHLLLKYLSLETMQASPFDKNGSLHLLLSKLPNLLRVSLSGRHLQYNKDFDLEGLAEILNHTVPRLAFFLVEITGTPPLCDPVDDIHPLFRHIVYSTRSMIILSHMSLLRKKSDNIKSIIFV